MKEFVENMFDGDVMRIRFLSASRTKIIIGCENCCAIQAVSGMHVTLVGTRQNTK
jgi:hypothetical protein